MKKNHIKRILLSGLVVCSLSIYGFAQSVNIDSNYRPGKYKELTEKFASETTQKGDFFFLGNSITAGTDWSTLLGLANARQRGISGDISYGVLQRLQEVIDRKPAKLFVLIGINDVARNIPDSAIVSNYKKIISRVRSGSKKTKIYFYTLLPVNELAGKFKSHYNKNEHIYFLNDEIRKLTAKNVTVIDLYPHFLDENNRLKTSYTYDGLHLSAEGYQVWKGVLEGGGYLKK
jgi:lysophospholipase L1-like esterase